ncbi:MAG: 30S ribosomal protein S4 [bacterium]|nr:30S ribosomal protein S4 [bacterium]
MKNDNCTICRRAGQKLFLKGERCLSPKCAAVRRTYPPGPKRKRRRQAVSEFGKELREKQNLKNWYNLGERQFENYVKDVLSKKSKVSDTAVLLIQKLEMRLDNAIFRLGFASSHDQARQYISHGHFMANNHVLTIPSYQLKLGEKINIKPASRGKKIFENVLVNLKKNKVPSWLKLDIEKLEGEVIGLPTLAEANPIAEISSIFEYYSR